MISGCGKERFMSQKLERLSKELQKARARQEEWTAKVKMLESKYRDLENAEINEIVRAAKLTPDELADVLEKAGLKLDHRQNRKKAAEDQPVPEKSASEEAATEAGAEGELLEETALKKCQREERATETDQEGEYREQQEEW